MKRIVVFVVVCLGCTSKEPTLIQAALSQPQLLEIYTTGLPAIEEGEVANIVARKYGFRYHAIAGCVVNEEISAKKYFNNRNVYPRLECMWGFNWRKEFNRQVDSAIEIHNAIEHLVNDETYIRKANDKFYKNGYSFDYHLTSTTDSSVFIVDVYIPPLSKDDNMCLIYYKLKVNIQQKMVEILSNQKKTIHASLLKESS